MSYWTMMTSLPVALLLLGCSCAVIGTPFGQQTQGGLNAQQQEQGLVKPLEHLDEEDGQYREELYSNANSIPGVPGSDYPVLDSIPRTIFSCEGKLPGFYADEEAYCQVWHYCKTDGVMESFLCPNGTIYNQVNRVCEWWFNVQCEDSIASYRVNEDLYIIPSSTPHPYQYPEDGYPQYHEEQQQQQQQQQQEQQQQGYYQN